MNGQNLEGILLYVSKNFTSVPLLVNILNKDIGKFIGCMLVIFLGDKAKEIIRDV